MAAVSAKGVEHVLAKGFHQVPRARDLLARMLGYDPEVAAAPPAFRFEAPSGGHVSTYVPPDPEKSFWAMSLLVHSDLFEADPPVILADAATSEPLDLHGSLKPPMTIMAVVQTDKEVLASAAAGSLAALKWYVAKRRIVREDGAVLLQQVAETAAEHGQLAVLDWLEDGAPAQGHRGVKWNNEYGQTVKRFLCHRVVTAAARGGQIAVFGWLDRRREGWSDDTVSPRQIARTAAEHGHWGVVKYAFGQQNERGPRATAFSDISHQAALGAAKGGHLDILKRLEKSIATQSSTSELAMLGSLESGSVNCAKYLAGLGVPYPHTVLRYLAQSGHIELALELVRTGTAQWLDNEVGSALSRRHWDFACRAYEAGSLASGQEELTICAITGNIDRALRIATTPNIYGLASSWGHSNVHRAIANGRWEFARRAIKAGAPASINDHRAVRAHFGRK